MTFEPETRHNYTIFFVECMKNKLKLKLPKLAAGLFLTPHHGWRFF